MEWLQIKGVELSSAISKLNLASVISSVRYLFAGLVQLRKIEWNRNAINQVLLIRASKLFDVKLSRSEKPKIKRKVVMRSIKNQISVKKSWWSRLFSSKKKSLHSPKRYRQYSENPFTRNVVRK